MRPLSLGEAVTWIILLSPQSVKTYSFRPLCRIRTETITNQTTPSLRLHTSILFFFFKNFYLFLYNSSRVVQEACTTARVHGVGLRSHVFQSGPLVATLLPGFPNPAQTPLLCLLLHSCFLRRAFLSSFALVKDRSLQPSCPQ